MEINSNTLIILGESTTGVFKPISIDTAGTMQTDVSKSEKITIIESDTASHFTGAIAQFAQETENITGLSDDRIFIRGINAQSIQKLKYRLIFWKTDTFDDTVLNDDSYIDDIILDFTNEESAFQIEQTNQYYLNISSLEILYEDADATNEIHCSLQNLSPTSKNAGATGEIQIDFKYAPRL